MGPSRLVRAVLVAALVLPAAGGAATADRTVTGPGKVLGLARSGGNVAFATAATPGDCFHVRIWNLASRGVYRLGARRPCGPETSTGQGIVGPVVGGNRALWVTFVGGNLREWSLWTATTTRRTPRLVRFVIRDVDATGPFVLGDGSAALLPYAFDERVIALAPSGARLFAWDAPTRVVDLSASLDRVAVLLADGRIVLLDREGAVRDTIVPRAAVRGLQALVRGVAFGEGSTLVVRLPTGEQRASLPAGARFLDYVDGLALYARGAEVRGLRLASGRDSLLRRGTFGALEPGGLSYAAGRRVASVAWVRLP